MEIKDKVGIVTGGLSGIGLAIVKELLNKNAKFIAVFDLDPGITSTAVEKKKILDELKRDNGEKVGFYTCDVTKHEQFSENFDNVCKTYNSVDMLINNAGIASDACTELMIDLNYKAVVMGTIKFINTIGKHKGGKGGVVINTASVLGLINEEMPIYCSTKHAVVSFTRGMAEQVNETGVRVIAICPGLTKTPIIESINQGLDFITRRGYVVSLPAQKPENVSSAVSQIIESGKSGEVWVSEQDEPPYAVKDFKDYRSLRITQ